jgi:hypothetical protein
VNAELLAPGAALGAYRELLAHAQLELELAGAGDVDALDGMGTRWQELVRALPSRPPAEAGPILARARLVHERTRVELLRIRERLLADAHVAGRARRTAEGYGGELQAPARVDRSA